VLTSSGSGTPRPGLLLGAPLAPAVLLLGAVAGLGAPWLLDLAARLGSHIPQPDMQTDYLVGWVWGVVIAASIAFWPVPEQDRPRLLALWAVKLGVALGFMLLYETTYTDLDAYGYFRSARLGDFVVWEVSGATQRIVGLARLHPELLRTSYHALKVSFALAGLLGVYFFYRAAVIALGRERPSLLLVLGLFPSVLFWSTILGKDPVVLMGLGLYALGVVGWMRTRAPRYLVLLALGVLGASVVRIWLAPIAIVPLFVLVLLSPRVRWTTRLAVLAGGAAAAGLLATVFARRLEVAAVNDALALVGSLSQGWAIGGSAQRITMDLSTPLGLAAFLPLGAFTALFRPLPHEAANAFSLLAAAENTLLLVLVVLAVLRVRRAELGDPIVRWAILLVLTWSGAYAIVSYQNLGAAVRFKAQILPVLLLLLLHLAGGRRHSGGDPESGPRSREGGP
jgi:hypothetical protein